MGDSTPSSRLKIAAGLVALVLIIALGRLLPLGEWLERFQRELGQMGPSAPLLFVLAYAVCCVLFIPASALSLAAGAIFGVPLGAVVVLTGATLGAVTSFLLARTIFRSRAQAAIEGSPRFHAIDRAVGRQGGRIVFLIRLSPLFPFTWVNYVFGLTAVKLTSYVLATVIGILPGTLAFVYIGSAAATAATGNSSPIRMAMHVIGAIATLVVSLYIARIARHAIAREGLGDTAVTAATAAEATPSRRQPSQ